MNIALSSIILVLFNVQLVCAVDRISVLLACVVSDRVSIIFRWHDDGWRATAP